MAASLGILVIRSSLVDWWSMKKECRHARHTCIFVIWIFQKNYRYILRRMAGGRRGTGRSARPLAPMAPTNPINNSASKPINPG